MSPVLLGVLAYLAVQLAIGVWVSRRVASETDYLLAGRSLGLALGAFSVFATWFGAESIVGAAGMIYEDGLSGGSADPFGYGVCLIVLSLALAAPLWRRRYTTFGDLFRERFSPAVEKFAVLLLVPATLLWAAAQIRAFGQIVSAASDLEVSLAISTAALFVVVYTAAGGLLADAITDLVQGAALIVGLVLLFVAINWSAGGFAETVQMIDPARLRLFATADQGVLEVIEAWAVPVVGSLLAIELISRILACRSAEVARRATLLGAGIYLAVGLIPVYLGLIGPSLVPGLEQPEQLIAVLAERHLSTFVYVLFAGALISAILSTVDSALLAAASLVSHNVVLRLRPQTSERGKVWTARAGVVVLGAIAYVLALHAGGIYELVVTASAFGSAGIFVVGIMGMFTRIGGAASAHAALATGVGVWLAGEYLLDWSTPYVASLACALVAYLATAPFAAAVERA